ncbi:MAG TPA: hypothetical protein VGP44_04525 [Gemmatimonadales bacterium]|nr:hypothetical protein [Gemmatimonadales bacterium]
MTTVLDPSDEDRSLQFSMLPTEAAMATRTTKGTVWLIAQPSVKRDGTLPDLTPLRDHGEIRTIVAAGEYPAFNPERCLRIVASRLTDFDPQTDFLAWAGGDTLSAFITGIVLGQLSARGVKSVRWLRHERPRDPVTRRRGDEGAYYIPVLVPITVEDTTYPVHREDGPNDGDIGDEDD